MEKGGILGLLGFLLSISAGVLYLITMIYIFITFGDNPSLEAVLPISFPNIIIGLILSGNGVVLSTIGYKMSGSRLGSVGLIIGAVLATLFIIGIIATFVLLGIELPGGIL